jgi:hypothetical protein
MSSIALSGNASGAGVLTVAAPNTASNYTLTLPAGTGTFTMNGVNSNIVSGTAQASTSGTSIDFTSIPSWVKRITVMFNQVSGSGIANFVWQIGSGSIDTTANYVYSLGNNQSGNAQNISISSTATYAAFFGVYSAASNMSGHLVLTNITGNTWISSSICQHTSTAASGSSVAVGSKALSGTLDRIRITTTASDTFDAGTINILYE